MKVSKCGGENTAPEELTWDEMIENEGVYRISGNRSEERLIVLRDGFCFELKPA